MLTTEKGGNIPGGGIKIVELRGVEPRSRQSIQQLSTCLVVASNCRELGKCVNVLVPIP